MKIIEMENLNKSYGKNCVLSNISISFDYGKCYMIIGVNGVGKSTFLKCILGVSKINSGSIKRNYSRLGYVPEKLILPGGLQVFEFLKMLALLKGMAQKEINKKIEDDLTIWKLNEKKNSKIGSLSKGMHQKLIIIQALLDNPDLVVFDEVLNGLDIEMQKLLFSLIREMKKNKVTIILTSHYPKEYDEVVDEVLEIKNGKIDAI